MLKKSASCQKGHTTSLSVQEKNSSSCVCLYDKMGNSIDWNILTGESGEDGSHVASVDSSPSHSRYVVLQWSILFHFIQLKYPK